MQRVIFHVFLFWLFGILSDFYSNPSANILITNDNAHCHVNCYFEIESVLDVFSELTKNFSNEINSLAQYFM